MGDIGINSSLLVASLDLQMVQGVIQAIRTADLSSAADRAGATAPAEPVSSASRAAIQTVVQTRYIPNSEKPAATFEPCPVHHWHTRLNDLQPYTPSRPVLPTECKPGIQPPWKVLPWPIRERSVIKQNHLTIKIQTGRVDTDDIGRTLDLFV